MKKLLNILLIAVILTACQDDTLIYEYTYVDQKGEEYVSCSASNVEVVNVLSKVMNEQTTYFLHFKSSMKLGPKVKAMVRMYENNRVALLFKKNQKFDLGQYHCLLNLLYDEDGNVTDYRKEITNNLVMMEVGSQGPESFEAADQRSYYQGLSKGDGSKDNPYQLNLITFKKFINSLQQDCTRGEGLYFKQTGDLNLSIYSNGDGTITGWYPLGYSKSSLSGFAGYYDGNNMIVKELTMNVGEPFNNAGFFSCLLPGSKVENLTIEEPHIELLFSDNVGALCGVADSATIINVHVDNPIILAHNTLGGMVGLMKGGGMLDKIKVDNVGHLEGNECVGGVIGGIDTYSDVQGTDIPEPNTQITNTIGEVYVKGVNNVGGIIGSANCRLFSLGLMNHSATVIGNDGSNVGGIIGYMNGFLSMDDSESVVEINKNDAQKYSLEGNNNVGGAIGYFYVRHRDSKIDGFCFKGKLLGKQRNLGGLIGGIENGRLQIFNVYSSTEGLISAPEDGDPENIGGLVGYANSDLIFESKDKINEQELRNSSMNISVPTAVNVGGIIGFAQGTVVMNNMSNVATINGKSDVGGMIGRLDGASVELFGCGTPGVFDNGTDPHQITISATDGYVGGLIGRARGGSVTIDGDTISIANDTTTTVANATEGENAYNSVFSAFVNRAGNDGVNYCGGVIGFMEDVSFKGYNFKVTGTVSGGANIGGVVGAVSLKQSDREFVMDDVLVDSTGIIQGKGGVGGFVGVLEVDGALGAKISNSTNKATIKARTSSVEDDSGAGFIGKVVVDSKNAYTLLSHCTNKGNVGIGGDNGERFYDSGGMIGKIYDYDSDLPLMEYCLNEGNIYGNVDVAGIIGEIASKIDGDIEHVHNKGTIEGWDCGKNSYIGGIVGYSITLRIFYAGNYGTIIGNACNEVGGLVGRVGASASLDKPFIVKESFNLGKIVDRNCDYSAGLVSYSGACANSSSEGIWDCYSMTTFDPKEPDKNRGAFVGYAGSITYLENLYHFGGKQKEVFPGPEAQFGPSSDNVYVITDMIEIQNEDFSVSISKEAAAKTSTFVGFDFENVWVMDSEAGRPLLRRNMEEKTYTSDTGVKTYVPIMTPENAK